MTYYDFLNWETLSHDFSESPWEITQTSLISGRNKSFSIHRKDDLSIEMVVNADPSSKMRRSKSALGKIVIDFNEMKMEDGFGSTAKAKEIFIPKSEKFMKPDGSITNKFFICINDVKVTHSNEPICYTVEWLTNLRPEGKWIWSDSTEFDLQGNMERKFISKNKVIISRRTDTLASNNRSRGLGFLVNDRFIFVSETDTDHIDNKYCPGFIMYEGQPTSDEMKKIRLGLSFALGRYLPSLGHTKFNENWDIINYKCINPYDMDGTIYDCQTNPPTRLNSKSDPYLIDADIISNFVSSFVNNFEKYNFRDISSLYWSAVCSPRHIKPSQFGATLEFTQREYIKNHKDKFQTKLLGKEWHQLKKEVVNSINRILPKNKQEKRILINKANGLNQTPQSQLADRFFEVLGLKLGELEKKTFKSRNLSAHGMSLTREQSELTRKNNKIWRTVINRVLIKILDRSPTYIDYYTPEYPDRSLSSAILES